MFFFRHESEYQLANPIKGQRIDAEGESWPELQITEPPSCPAEIWIQLVEQKNDSENNPCPSPNGLFLKQYQKDKDLASPHGIEIQSDGDLDGKKTF